MEVMNPNTFVEDWNLFIGSSQYEKQGITSKLILT